MGKISVKRRNESERADHRAALYVIFYIGRRKIRIPLGIAVTADEWDERAGRIKGRSKECADNNLIISNTLARVSDIQVKARLAGKELTPEGFMALYNREPETDGFVDFARRRVKALGGALKWETRRHHLAVLKKLDDYAPGLTFSDITPDFLRTYGAYLRDRLSNAPGTIGKNMSVIHMHLVAAMREGKVTDDPFTVYRPPVGRPSVVFLTEDELNALVDIFMSGTLKDKEMNVLRLFLFMTFTGMHISDARELLIEQIFGGEIHYHRMKTGTRVDMPLARPAQALVAHYAAGRSRGLLIRGLPSNSSFNYTIKGICRRVGIMKAVSAKAARHTFATLYYKKNAGDVGTLSKLLGHTSINTTMIYTHIMKDSRLAGMAAFDDMMPLEAAKL